MTTWPPDATAYCEFCEQYIYNGKEHWHPNLAEGYLVKRGLQGTPIQIAYTTRQVNAEFFVDAVRNYHTGITFFYFDNEAHINPATLVR